MSSEAIQSEFCLVCAETPLPASSVRGAALGDLPGVCSPCRAEHTGEVELRLPEGARLDDLVTRHFVIRQREFLPGKGAREALRQWEEALDTGARRLGLLRTLLEAGSSDAEAVAEVLLTGGEMRFNLRAQSNSVLRLTDLSPLLARRLAQEGPEIASGPELPRAEMLRLLAEARRR